jgi:hypothetical protein
MMIQVNDPRCRGVRRGAPAPAAGRTRHRGQDRQGWQRLRRAGGGALTSAVLTSAVLIGAVLLPGCAAGHPGPGPALTRPEPARLVPAAAAAGSLVRVSRPDYADPASVAAAFYTAWAGVDAVHDGPLSFAARCAPLATPALARQLAASQLPAAAWQAMRREQLVSLVRVRAVTRPDGAPAPAPSVVYLRVYASRVTVTTAGRGTVSDGVTVQLTRTGGRWLVSAVLFW